MSNMEMPPQGKGPDRSVVDQLRALQQEIALMGANDFEVPEIERIIGRFESGDCTAEEALDLANKIREAKQDYH